MIHSCAASNRPWYQRWQSWAVIAGIAIFSVYGLIAMWLFAPWTRRSKWVVTIGYLGVFFLSVVAFLFTGGP